MPKTTRFSVKRLEALRQKLSKVVPSEQLESLVGKSGPPGAATEAGNLESLGPEGGEGDTMRLDVLRSEKTTALRKLQDGNFDDVSDGEGMALEAIVERQYRQVAFIKGGVFDDLPHPWTHFNSGRIRDNLNAMIPSIGRVERLSPTGKRTDHVGTGFIVGECLMMTNRHVAEVFVRGAGAQSLVFKPGLPATYDFGREAGFIPTDLGGTLTIKKVKMVHPYWDMALFELDSLPAGINPLKLSVAAPEDIINREIATIGYPGRGKDQSPEALQLEQQYFGGIYGVKRIAPGRLEGRDFTPSFKHYVHAMVHDSSTLAGASGSAIVDALDRTVVGLHFKGITLKGNYSVPLYELARDQRVLDAGVKFEGSVAVTSEWESWWQNPNQCDSALEGISRVLVPVAKPDRISSTNPINNPKMPTRSSTTAATVAVPAGDGSSSTWTIPLSVTVSIGPPVGGASVAAPEAGGVESFQIPIMYDGMDEREGYKPGFLNLSQGELVPLPELTATGRQIVARQQSGEAELKYHHFSIVMHKKRRLALFTAANLDWRKTAREVNGRKPKRSELSGIPDGVMEQWASDDRIAVDEQLPDVFFTRDRGSFDKGHLVRRDDAAWGTSFEDMQMANGDTYYTTNCSPQVKGFNQSQHGDYNWGDLENMVQKETRSEKAILFSGPVFAQNDRIFVGLSETGAVRVQIPKRFWKIIVARTDDGVKAFGFMLKQDFSQVNWEEFALPEDWREFQVPIAEIEENLNGFVTLDWCKAHDALG